MAIDAIVLARDRRPGLAVDEPSSSPGVAKEGALGTAERVATRFIPDGVAGDVAGGAADTGAQMLRQRGMLTAALEPIPKGTPVLIFINQAFKVGQASADH